MWYVCDLSCSLLEASAFLLPLHQKMEKTLSAQTTSKKNVTLQQPRRNRLLQTVRIQLANWSLASFASQRKFLSKAGGLSLNFLIKIQVLLSILGQNLHLQAYRSSRNHLCVQFDTTENHVLLWFVNQPLKRLMPCSQCKVNVNCHSRTVTVLHTEFKNAMGKVNSITPT